MKQRVCVALDVDTLREASELARLLSPWVGIFKIGSQLFSSEGPRVIEAIQKTGALVFLDLKYHDIPNTVAQATRVATSMGVFMLNVHSLGGSKMMRHVAEEVREEALKSNVVKPIVLAITVLTSMSSEDLKADLLIDVPLADYVTHLARLSQKAGLDGVVCSPKEAKLLRSICGPGFKLITPGIRPSWSAGKDDQARITTPAQAIADGADFIVIGRPIVRAANPERAAQDVLKELQGKP
jgi:orotidine-5'-phosphate decarboxylase